MKNIRIITCSAVFFALGIALGLFVGTELTRTGKVPATDASTPAMRSLPAAAEVAASEAKSTDVRLSKEKEQGQEDMITLPKTALDLIYAPIFPPGADELILAKNGLKKLGVNSMYYSKIDGIFKKTLQSIAEMEEKNARLVDDVSMGQYYVIDALPKSGESIASELKESLSEYMPAEIAEVLVRQAEKSSLFGKFGQFRQEIYMQEIEIEGKPKPFVVIKFFNSSGREVISDQSAHLAKIANVRYKHLFESVT